MDQMAKNPLLKTITGFLRRLQNISYRCGQTVRVNTKSKQHSQVYKKTPLQKKLNKILSSGVWDDSRLTPFLVSTEDKPGNESAMVIERDLKAITNFLERVSNDLHDAPSWLTAEETQTFEESRFRIDDKNSFIFEIDIIIESLSEMAVRSLVQQKSSREHSLRSKSGGEKPKMIVPIFMAIIQFLEKYPLIVSKSKRHITTAFVNELPVTNSESMIVNCNKCEWHIYYTEKDKLIFADPVPNKYLNKIASRAFDTIRRDYIPKALEEMKIKK